MAYVEIWRDRDKRRPTWRWHRVAGNGEIVADSEGYTRRWSAKRAATKQFPKDDVRILS